MFTIVGLLGSALLVGSGAAFLGQIDVDLEKTVGPVKLGLTLNEKQPLHVSITRA